MNALGELTLEEDAALTIDASLRQLIQSLDPAGLETRALPPAAMVSAATAVHFAQAALAETDIPLKMQLAMAASYAAAFFGLPRNNLLYVVDQVCGMFALTSSQRRDYHARATALLDSYVMSLKKGSAMSRSLGILQAGAFRDGSLGILQAGAFRDGSLGMPQAGAFRDGSLGMPQAGAFRDGSLGRHYTQAGVAFNRFGRRRMQLRGLGGGCGCAGVGDDAVAVATETPFYKKPLVIAGAAAVLGVVIYGISKR